ncbi:ABC transporter permease [Halosquirtibacter xylanolyticus]|uniref:ABC transporter permease n=1 Tax=Halosquirtibacter xylanolyticus TaxID=3374599 RepID=UPI00374956EC|nr:ABC transporter permease [Prolixibacteraceae bacterium]
MEIRTILWREFIFFKNNLFRITSSAIMSPFLYFIAFGWGLGQGVVVEGHPYNQYIVPGIIALSSMGTSFNAVSIRILVSKLHERSFEFYMTAPVRLFLLTLGNIIAGALRGLYAALLILIVTFLFGIQVDLSISLLLVTFLNCLLFASFGYIAAMVVNTHYDMNRFTTFLITPMTFLCGTFFSLDNMPYLLEVLIKILPLTHASIAIRALMLDGQMIWSSVAVLFLYFVGLLWVGVWVSRRELGA